MQQKLRVLHETFFAGKIALKQNLQSQVSPVFLLLLPKLKRSFTEK